MMNKIKNNKKILISLLLLLFLVGAAFGNKSTFAAIEIYESWGPTIDRNEDRYIGGPVFYERNTSYKSSCESTGRWSNLFEKKVAHNNYIYNAKNDILFREFTNANSWNLVCDAEGDNEVYEQRTYSSTPWCEHNGSDYTNRESVYVDLGSYTEEDLSIKVSIENGSTFSADEETKIFTLDTTAYSYGPPGEIRRIEIYLNNVYLKTIFPDPSTQVEIELSRSELLNIDAYRPSPSSTYYDEGAVLDFFVYGESDYGYNTFTSVKFEPYLDYLPQGVDITVYGSASYGGITPHYFLVNSLDQGIYIDNRYIDPSMTPISIKANGEPNYIKGNGWFVEIGDSTQDLEFVNVNDDGTSVYSSDIYYEGEDIKLASLTSSSYSDVTLNYMNLNGVYANSNQYSNEDGLIVAKNIVPGKYAIDYEYTYVYNGDTRTYSRDKNIIVLKNDLNKIRDFFWNDGRYFQEDDLKNNYDRPILEYTTSWGTSGTVLDDPYGTYEGGSFKDILIDVLYDSSTRWLHDYYNYGANYYYNNNIYWDPVWEQIDYSNDSGDRGIDYNGSIEITMSFFDGDFITKTIPVSDIFNISKVRDIEAVGTYFKVDVNEDYLSAADMFSEQNTFFRILQEKNRQIITGNESEGPFISSAGGKSYLLGNSYYGILNMPGFNQELYKSYYTSTLTSGGQSGVYDDEYSVSFSKPKGKLDFYNFSIVNIPFSSPYYYLHEPFYDFSSTPPVAEGSCPLAVDIETIIDDPLPPPPPGLDPLPEKPDNFVLSATTTADCHEPEGSLNVELSWGDIGYETGYSLYIDYNRNGFYEDETSDGGTEKIADLSQNTTSYTHNIKEIPDFRDSRDYDYQIIAWYEFEGVTRSYKSETSFDSPDECLPPLDCGSITENTVWEEPDYGLCSTGAYAVYPPGVSTTTDELGWQWECTDGEDVVGPCNTYCPAGYVVEEVYYEDYWGDYYINECVPEPKQCGLLDGDEVNNKTEIENSSNLCPSGVTPSIISINDNNDGWYWQCDSPQNCNAYCPSGQLIYNGQCEESIQYSSVEILQFEANPSIINPEDSCLFDWQIDTDNSNLISCTITSDNPKDAPENLKIIKDEIGKISGNTIDDSDYPFDNVDSTTEYTLTCNEYDPDTDTVGSVIDSKKTKCMINPAFYEF